MPSRGELSRPLEENPGYSKLAADAAPRPERPREREKTRAREREREREREGETQEVRKIATASAVLRVFLLKLLFSCCFSLLFVGVGTICGS